MDGAGNLYVVDDGALRKVAPGGVVSTFPTIGSVPLEAVAADAAGNVYVAESASSRAGTVRKYSGQGQVLPWGPAADGGVTVNFPVGLAVDGAGNVYVASNGVQSFSPRLSFTSKAILKITPAGQVSTVSGAENDARTVDGPAAVARFRDPIGVSVGADGRILVTERDTSALRQISAQGVVSMLAGGMGDGFVDGQAGAARFFNPYGLAAGADGALFVADSSNEAVRKISPAGLVSTFATVSGSPETLALNSAATLFVESSIGPLIRTLFAVDPSGTSRSYADSSSHAGVTVDPAGRVLLGGSSVVRINEDGSRQVVADGFSQLGGIVASPSGVVYVAYGVDHTVRAISADGVVTVLAGQSAQPGYADGVGAQARLDLPSALALDSAGNLYVADAATIRRITPQGEVRTVAGVAGQSGVQPGPAAGAARARAWPRLVCRRFVCDRAERRDPDRAGELRATVVIERQGEHGSAELGLAVCARSDSFTMVLFLRADRKGH